MGTLRASGFSILLREGTREHETAGNRAYSINLVCELFWWVYPCFSKKVITPLFWHIDNSPL